eukprot:scaffold1086_cov397-Prasinococcus_capsulatus_cf.AAC.8
MAGFPGPLPKEATCSGGWRGMARPESPLRSVRPPACRHTAALGERGGEGGGECGAGGAFARALTYQGWSRVGRRAAPEVQQRDAGPRAVHASWFVTPHAGGGAGAARARARDAHPARCRGRPTVLGTVDENRGLSPTPGRRWSVRRWSSSGSSRPSGLWPTTYGALLGCCGLGRRQVKI